MLNEHTLDQLRSLRLDGMVHALEDQAASTAAAALAFDDRLTLLVQREVAWRDDRRVARLLKAAKLKVTAACIEDIDWRASRSLDRGLIATLAGGDWLRHARNLLICGATGSGKTWLACALAHQAARTGFSVLYVRAARLFDELQIAHGDGSFARRLAALAKLDLLVLDDFAISPIGPAERNDLLEVIDDRIGSRSTLITSQLPVREWHTYLNDPTPRRRHPRPHRPQQPQDRTQGRPVDARQRGGGVVSITRSTTAARADRAWVHARSGRLRRPGRGLEKIEVFQIQEPSDPDSTMAVSG